MGGWGSKQDIPGTPETPHFATDGKLFQLSAYDPRSPTGNRTPLILPDPLLDPRSPSFDDVDRTPIFAIPDSQSPILRFRYDSDNAAFQDSPLSKPEDPLDSGHMRQTADLDGTSKDRCIPDELSDSLTEMCTKRAPFKCNLDSVCSTEDPFDIGSMSEKVSAKIEKNAKQLRNPANRKFRRIQQPMLKTVLFTPLVDEGADGCSKLHSSPVTSMNVTASSKASENDRKTGGRASGLEVRNDNVQQKAFSKSPLSKLTSEFEKENWQL